MDPEKAPLPGREYSQAEMLAKLHLRRLRINLHLSMNAAARIMDMTRKNLEDLETMRGYGCHVTWNHIIAGCLAYSAKPSDFSQSMALDVIETLWPGESIPFDQSDCWWLS